MRVVLATLTAFGGGTFTAANAAATLPHPTQQNSTRNVMAASVAYGLATSNKARCGNSVAPMSGLVLGVLDTGHANGLGHPGLAHPGLAHAVRVTAVVADSPAGKAGVAANERLISINGVELPVGTSSDSPSIVSKFVEQAKTVLRTELAKGAVTLRMTSRDGARAYRFVPDWGCQSNVQIIDSSDVNAWADGTRVLLTSAILGRCDNEADIAFVIAHEMAHNILHHRARLASARHPRSGLLPTSAATAAVVRETEEEADREAVALMAASGYDPSAAATFLDRLLNPVKGPRRAAATHPDAARRLALLRAAIATAVGPAVL